MQTALTGPALLEQRAKAQEKTDAGQDGEMITNPGVLAAFDFIVTSPLKAVGIIMLVLLTSGYVQKPYEDLKNAPMELEVPNTRLADVVQVLQKDFGMQGTSSSPDGIVIWCDSCHLLREPGFSLVLDDVKGALRGLQANVTACRNLTWQSYEPTMLPSIAKPFLSTDGTASIVMVNRFESLKMQQISDCVMAMHGSLLELDGKYPGLRAAMGTQAATAMMTSDAEIQSVLHHIAISGPLLCLLFWMYVGSVAKALTPLVCFACCAVTNRAVVVLVKLGWASFNFAQPDTTVMFVQLALALDYAVIFWGRFNQERAKRTGADEYLPCILTTLKTSGLVIFVSVAVLEVAFAGLLFYPDLNATASLALTVQLMASTALVGLHSLAVPAAFAAWLPRWYDQGPAQSGDDRVGERPSAPGPGAAQQIFRWFSAFSTRWPWVIVLPLVTYACMMPFLIELTKFQPNYDLLNAIVAPGVPEYDALQVYKTRFLTNQDMPVVVLLQAERLDLAAPPDEDSSALLQRGRFGHRSAALVPAGQAPARGAAALRGSVAAPQPAAKARGSRARRQRWASRGVALTATSASRDGDVPLSYSTVTLSPGFRDMTCRLAEAIVNGTRNTAYEIRATDIDSVWWDPATGRCVSYPRLLAVPISQGGMEQIFHVHLPFSAMGPPAQALTRFMWDVIEPLAQGPIEFAGDRYHYSARQWSLVAETMTYDNRMAARAPWIVLGTVVGICAVVGLFFNSVGVSIKVLLSVVVPILCDYGLLVAIWQSGWLEWAGIHADGGVLGAGMMETTFGFLLGLAIDYDVVLFARVYERRMQGYDNTSAVQMGLEETGPMITLAGTLMALSFFVMVFDRLDAVKQMATLYFFGVAIDTYIVRTCIAPTMLCLAGRLNYWPSKMPPETKSWAGVA